MSYAGWIIVALVVWVAMHLLFDWRRSGRLGCRPLPAKYADRPIETVWREAAPDATGEAVDAVLGILCEVFSFNPADRFRFRPDDRPSEIYQALYRCRWCFARSDNLELERQLLELHRQFGVDAQPDHTLQDLAKLVAAAWRTE